MKRSIFVLAVFAIAIVGPASSPAVAAIITVFHDNFEAGSPGDVPGVDTAPLVGSWTVATNDNVNSVVGDPTWKLVDSPQGTSPLDNTTQFVRAGRSNTGSLVGNSVTYADLSDPGATAGQLVEIRFDFYVPAEASGLWLVGSSDVGDLSPVTERSFDVRFLGDKYRDTYDAGDAWLPTKSSSYSVADAFIPDAWQSALISVDYENETFDVFVNGAAVETVVGFWGDPGTNSLASIRIAGNSTTAALEPTEFAYLDNLRVTVIPEPGTLTLLSLVAGAALLPRRKKRSAR